MKTAGPVRALILAGGSGTRLWPRSTDLHPKPFLPLAGRRTLLRDTYDRAVRLAGGDGVLISGRRSHAGLIRREIPELPVDRLFLEPFRRNTAPAIALAALRVHADDESSLLVVLPSDQAVRDEETFLSALETGIETARGRAAFVTLGVGPTRAETGFGYLETDPGEAGKAARRVLRFVEKPALEVAERYLAAGTFFWNAGIFIFRTAVLLREMERLCPEVLAAARRASEAMDAGDEAGFDEAFGSVRAVSIDVAVMERAEEVYTVPCACGWSDLGSWEAVYEYRGGDGVRSVLEGPAVSVDGEANLVLAGDRPIRVIGISGVVVVDSSDGILVMKRGASDALRASVEESLAEAKK